MCGIIGIIGHEPVAPLLVDALKRLEYRGYDSAGVATLEHVHVLVTDGGQLIRCPVDGIRIAGRSTQGVIVFATAEGEKVASVEGLSEDNGYNADTEEKGD